MNTLTVRQAGLTDLDAMAPLFDQYRQFQGQPADPHAARAFLRARLDHGESVVFLAFDEVGPVGLAQLYPSYSSVSLRRVFVLNDLFVSERGRRQQVATQLLAAVEQHAWALDAVRVSLNVARDNPTAQALYRARGWQADDQFLMFHRRPLGVSPAG